SRTRRHRPRPPSAMTPAVASSWVLSKSYWSGRETATGPVSPTGPGSLVGKRQPVGLPGQALEEVPLDVRPVDDLRCGSRQGVRPTQAAHRPIPHRDIEDPGVLALEGESVVHCVGVGHGRPIRRETAGTHPRHRPNPGPGPPPGGAGADV